MRDAERAAQDARAALSGENEVPPVDTDASGSATIGLNPLAITVTLETQGLTDAIAAHIHCAPPGVNGPIIFQLYATTDGPLPSVLTKRLTEADLILNQSITTFLDSQQAIASGQCYVNVHTAAHADGEIRGQIAATEVHASLTGAHEVPANPSTASGRASQQPDRTWTIVS